MASGDKRGPTFNADDIKAQLERYDRTPFIDLLTNMVMLFPTDASLRAMATKKPDAYINSMIALARIAGFTEKQEMTHNININVAKMSDSQLEDHLKRLMHDNGMQVIEGEVVETGDALQAAAHGKKEGPSEEGPTS